MLDLDKLDWFLSAARAAGVYAPIMVASATGLRCGELLALTWTDFDEKTGSLTVSKSIEQTKQGLRE